MNDIVILHHNTFTDRCRSRGKHQNHVEARIISTEAPIDDAINVEPTLEDLYLKYFSDEMEAGENS